MNDIVTAIENKAVGEEGDSLDRNVEVSFTVLVKTTIKTTTPTTTNDDEKAKRSEKDLLKVRRTGRKISC